MSRYLSALFAIAIVVIFAVIAFVPWGFWLSGNVDLSSMLAPPSGAHPLGADNLGRDLLFRLSMVLRETVIPLWLAVLVFSATSLALTMMLISLPRSGAFSRLYLILCQALASVPAAIIAFVFAAVFAEAGFLPVVLSLSGVLAARSASQLHQLYLRDRRRGFWVANEMLGGSKWNRILHYGLLKEWRSELLALVFFHLRAVVTIEAAISYLGFGVQEPKASFGNILAAHLDRSLAGDYGVVVVVLAVLVITMLTPTMVVRIGDIMASRATPPKTWRTFSHHNHPDPIAENARL